MPYIPVRFCLNCGAPLAPDQMFCANCGTKRFIPPVEAVPTPYPGMPGVGYFQPPAPVPMPPANHMRAVWAAVIFAASWIMLLLFQGFFGKRMLFSADTTWFIVAALLAAGTYLLVQQGTKYKLLGAAAGLIATVFSASTGLAVTLNSQKVGAFSVWDTLNFTAPQYMSLFLRSLLFVALTLGAAFLVGLLMRKKGEKSRALGAAGAAGVVYALSSLIAWIVQYARVIARIDAASLFSVLLGFLSDSIVLFFVVWILHSLCHTRAGRIRLFGLGKGWAILATVGMAASIAMSFGIAFKALGGFAYTASLLLAVAGTVGYIMLLAGRRMGLYVIVLAAVVVLGGQFFGSLSALIYGVHTYTTLFFGSIGGGLNPLFAWLAVRQADRQNVH